MTFNQLRLGTILNQRYRIEELIGQGGMGAVYRATDQTLGITVALKQSLIPLHDPHAQQMMRREAQLLARLEHPNLPKVTDYFDDQYGQFLVMQYLPGPDLGAMLEQQVATYRQPFTWLQVQPWATDLLKVLAYLHSKGIVHRDIKPSNLKLAADGRVMLLDFGLAKGSDSTSMMHSYKGFTRHYASFEQQQGIPTDARSDLYSLAATLYTLLSNALPSDALSRMRVKSKQTADPLPPLHSISPTVPRAVSDVLMHALALEPDDRPQSAEQMLTQLQYAASSSIPRSTASRSAAPPTVAVPQSLPPNNRFPLIPLIVGGSGALVLLLTFVVIVASMGSSSNAGNPSAVGAPVTSENQPTSPEPSPEEDEADITESATAHSSTPSTRSSTATLPLITILPIARADLLSDEVGTTTFEKCADKGIIVSRQTTGTSPVKLTVAGEPVSIDADKLWHPECVPVSESSPVAVTAGVTEKQKPVEPTESVLWVEYAEEVTIYGSDSAELTDAEKDALRACTLSQARDAAVIISPSNLIDTVVVNGDVNFADISSDTPIPAPCSMDASVTRIALKNNPTVSVAVALKPRHYYVVRLAP